MKKNHPRPEPQNLEDLYAKVNKPHRRGGQRILSPEEIQANRSRFLQPERVLYANLGGRGDNTQEPLQEDPYDTPKGRTNEHDTSPPQQQPETVYAPQRPLGNPYDRPGGTPSNGQRAKKLANPYEVVNLSTGESEFQHRENPLYDSLSGRTQDMRQPQSLEQHLYAELDFGSNDGPSPHKSLESVYAELGMGAEDSQESQQQVNPIYEGVGRTTTPPRRISKDAVTTRLLQHVDFQYGVRETQEWCTVVYGNQHALNQQLAKILEDPQGSDKILWDLAEHPESAGKLVGRQILGVKSPDRKAAEDGFSPLFSALERHIHKTKKLHKQFTREHERDQKQESPERDAERKQHHHHHRHHHERGHNQDSPEHSPQRQRQGKKGMAYAM